MIHIPLNADVECTDGTGGRSTHVIVDPATRHVTHFVVKAKAEREHVPEGEFVLYKDLTVQAADGKVGKVDELLVDETAGEVTHFVMQEGHLWGKKHVIVPLSLVDHVHEDAGFLIIDKATFHHTLPSE